MESIDENFGGSELKLTGASIENLRMTARWANFISIVGFVFIGLMLLGAFAIMGMSNSYSRILMGNIDPMTIGIIYLIMAVIYFFPVFYLFQFASKMKQSIEQKNSLTMDEATSFLRRHYQFIGILTIIGISLYVLGILIGILASGMR